jgi:hypothetical protein
MKYSLPLFGKRGRGAVYTAVSVLLLVAALLLGIGGNALKTAWNSYIDSTPEGLYTLTDTFVKEVSGIKDEIRIIFCSDPDKLLEDATTRYVYIMAREIEKAMPNVKVECYNVAANPTAVQEFRTTSSTEIGPRHVIVSCDKRYRVVAAQAFWSTDTTTNTYFAFNGEYKMATTMLSITAIERPVAYMTVGHGEQHYLTDGLTDAERERHRAFYQLLLDGGMEVRTIDLDTAPAVPDDCVLLIMNGPTEDYAPTEDEILSVDATSSLEKIDRYLDTAGSLMLFKDPAVTMPALEELLGEWGIAYAGADIVKDPAADADLSEDDTRDRFSVVYPDKDKDALGYSLFGEVAGLATAPATAIRHAGHLTTTWDGPTKFVSNDTSAMTSAVLRAPATCRTYDGTGAVTDNSGDYVLASMTARVSVVNDVQDYYSYVFCAATTSLTDSEYLDDPSLGNYDVMFSTVRFISRTDVYASDALGGLNMNTTTFGGKRLQSVALSNVEVPKYENGKLVHTYPAMTVDVILAWTVLIMLPPIVIAALGIFFCVRRRHR